MLSSKLPWELANPQWAAEINPVLSNPASKLNILKNIPIASGTNVINHGLGRMQQGWILVDIQSDVTIYRNSPFTNTTLSLFSSGNSVISLGVF